MRQETWLHVTLSVAAVIFTTVAAWHSGAATLWLPVERRGELSNPHPEIDQPLHDATGKAVPRGDYQRIVACDGIDILLGLVPASRIVGIDDWSIGHALGDWRVVDRPRIASTSNFEKILACHPDLVVTCSQGNPASREAIATLRSLGVTVFDIGYLVTIQDLLREVRAVGELLKRPALGDALADSLARRCRIIARTVPDAMRRSALFLCTAGDSLTICGSDDIFHDLLLEAGLHNVGADAGYRLMPLVSLEKVLVMDPEVLVIRPGNARAVREFPGLSPIRAMQPGGVIAVIPKAALGIAVATDLVDAAESIRDQVRRHENDRSETSDP